MSAIRITANIVIVAKQFNPSIIDRHWLVKNEILTEADFKEGCVFIPVLSQVRTQQFDLIVLPEQLQFSPASDLTKPAEVVSHKLGQIIDKLPETPYSAAGINFMWQLSPPEGDTRIVCRNLFFRHGSRLYDLFDRDDAQFGAYLSKDEMGCRLKLDIKPIIVDKGEGKAQALNIAFNFHRDLFPDNRLSSIHDLLERWEEAERLAGSIAKAVEEECKLS